QRETARLADRQRRRQAALHTRDQLARAEVGVQARRDELAAAARAAEVAPALAEAERTAAALTHARAAEEQARSAVGPVIGTATGASAAALRDAGQQHVARFGRLEALRSVSRQADDEDQAAAMARAAAKIGRASGSGEVWSSDLRTAAALTHARAAEEQARSAVGPVIGTATGASAAALRDAGQQHVARFGRLEALRSVSRQADDEDQAAAMARAAA